MQFNTRPGGPGGGMQGGPGGPGGPPGGPYGGGKGGGGGSGGPQDMNQGQGPMGNMGGGPGGPGPNNMNQGGPGGPPGSGQVGGGGGGGGHQEPDWSVKNDASEFEKENDFVQFFKYIQGHHSCTHSSMIGPSDHRIPRSGKFDITKPEALQKLYHAVSFFYRQGKPLVLCEIATSRFRFFEDVDLILTADLKDSVANLQNLWIDHLLRHRAAVLGAVWRSDDPLGVKCRYTYDPENNQTERATVHVFSSSGWSSRHNLPKISLHFVWPNLIVTPREAKGIRSATIEFLRESCSPELSELLKGFQANHLLLQNQQQMNQGGPKAQFPSEDVSPWEEIFDKAATEGTSLRLVWCDKGSKADMNLKSAARLEGRPKLPVGTYSIPLIAGDPSKCIPECTEPPSSKTDVQWLIDASIRLDGSISEIPPVSNVWLSASQTKGLAGIQLSRPNASIAGGGGMMNDGSANDYGPGGMNNGGMNQGGMGAPNNGTNGMGVGMGMNNQMSNGQNGGPDSGEDAFSTIKKELLGKHVDQNSNWMTVEEYNPPVSEKMAVKLDATGAQIAELVISPDVYSMPVDIDYISMDGSGKCYRMSFMPSIDKYGTFFLLNNGNEGENGPYNPSTATIIPMEQGGSSWMWRKPAVPQLDQRTGEVSVWPSWAEFILIEIAGSADSTDKSMGLAAIICAVSNVPTSGKVHGESFWKGHMSFSSKDFVNSEDVPVAVNVPLATVAAVVFGLKAVLDLREKIGGPKIKGIFISSDHTVVEAAVDGGSSTPQYLEAIVKLLSVYKQEILDDDCFPSCYNFAVSKISASSNKAAKLAREARAGALDEEMPGCSMGDIELYDSVISCCEAAAKMGGGGGAKQY